MAPAKGQVPETILKKRKRDDEWAAKKAALVADTKKKSKSNRKDIFKRAEQYVKEYRDQVWILRDWQSWSAFDVSKTPVSPRTDLVVASSLRNILDALIGRPWCLACSL
jgi:hypothetical protein